MSFLFNGTLKFNNFLHEEAVGVPFPATVCIGFWIGANIQIKLTQNQVCANYYLVPALSTKVSTARRIVTMLNERLEV